MGSQRRLAPHLAVALQAGRGRPAPQTMQPSATAGFRRPLAPHVAQALARPAPVVARCPAAAAPAPPPHAQPPVPHARSAMPPHARPGVPPFPPHPPLPLGATVQAKVSVAITGTITDVKDLTITRVRVFERTYPGPKSILGTEGKGSHRSHMLGWDVHVGDWEKRYVGQTIDQMAKHLGCGSTMLEVEDAFASKIDAEAQKTPMYWSQGTSNMKAGANYRAAKDKYVDSSDNKRINILDKKQKKDHAALKRAYAGSALEYPTKTEVDLTELPQNERKKLLDDLRTKRKKMIKFNYDTDSADIDSGNETRL